ncbi:unnamed protein product [Gemmataceae bacterium]|jgi:hypothetical protein|nr:unnamed protein product [Gemmataceae bacterium]VTU02690.1 unnamed protein product [Gemmataceae bacterium]
MRRVVIVGLLVMSCAACTRFAGPLAVRQMDRADAPGYTIEEQEKRGRARLAITEDEWAVGPYAYIDRPSPIGR